MQKYQCHKKVKAFEIGIVEGNIIHPKKHEYDAVNVSDLFLDRNPIHQPGYLIEYEDGYISWSPKSVFEAGYSVIEESTGKTLHNSTVSGARKNIPDLVVFGDGDTFKLICKASSKKEGWMKSTKAMEIKGVGCVIQVTTQQGDSIAEALVFVPNVSIFDINDDEKNGREITRVV